MFLHLGGDVVVPKKDIIAILNIRAGQAAVTKEFIKTAGDEGFIINIYAKDREKSFVVTNREIYMSPISCSTLKKRADDVFEL